MRKRIVICSLTFLALAAGSFAAFWFLQPRPRIDEQAFARIEHGMTEQQVIDIIGAPPGNYGVGEGELNPFNVSTFWIFPEKSVKTWLGRDKAIQIGFADDGKVLSKNIGNVWREYDSHLHMVGVWFRLADRKPRPVYGRIL
jgi:hypothetical protein